MVGVTRGSIVIERVAVVAHCPAAGVNVYTVVPAVVVLIVAGLHDPVIPLEELLGRAGAVLLWQRGPTALKVGVIKGLTVTLNVAVVAHCPAVGVNVYTVVPALVVLIIAGLQVPVIPLEDDAGKAGAVEL